MQRTKNAFEIHSFLRLAGYYRRFVKGFSKLAGPLTHLTWKGVKFKLSDKCEALFEKLKRRLTSALIHETRRGLLRTAVVELSVSIF